MGEKYRPSCGSEGADFIAHWCCNCERDRNEDCPIVAATFCYDVDDPEYPAEWVYDEAADPLMNSPRCTAFVQLGDPLPTPRCEQTPDIFHAEPALSCDDCGAGPYDVHSSDCAPAPQSGENG